jgi:broad specificity phosphatase PhoE
MEKDPEFSGNDSESSVRARVRMRAFQAEVEPILESADVLAFSHYGALRALIANLRGFTDAEMMSFDVPNGGVFLFERVAQPDGAYDYVEQTLPSPVLPRTAPKIEPPAVGLPQNLR